MKVESAVLRLIIHGDKGKLKPLFNTMYTEEGLANVETFFNRKSGGEKALDENKFMKIVYAKLLDLNDINILKLFDILDKKRNGSVAFREFFLLISMLAAREDGLTTACLYIHGKEFFNLLNSPRTGKTLHFEQFARLGFIAGIPEEYVATRLKEFGSSTQDRLDYETFIMCYFDLLSQLDEFVKRRNSQALDDSGAEGKRCIIC